jgi:glycosyltransferase involved in cell wall biosynthesis
MKRTQESNPLSADLIMVLPHLGDGGAQRVVSTLANAWSRQGRRVCVITLFDEEDVYRLDPSVPRIRLNLVAGEDAGGRALRAVISFLERWRVTRWIGSSCSVFNQIIQLRRIIKQMDPPLVLAFTWPSNIRTILACLGLGKRVVISERNDPARKVIPSPWNGLRRWLYKYADLVTANSRGALKTMQAYVDQEKLAFVPNPLVRPNLTTDGSRPVSLTAPFVLTVGRLHAQKAHDVLLEAFARLPAELADWRLVIVGRGEQKDALQAQARALAVAARVDWYGQVADPFLFYHAAQMFVLASRYEGMPNALLEAMSCGLPVIVSDASPGPLELVSDGETGLVVPVNDAGALARAIERLATDAALRRRLGEAGRARVAEYELPRALAKWEQIIGLSAGDYTARSSR